MLTMKRLRLERWSGQLLVAQPRPATPSCPPLLSSRPQRFFHPVRPQLVAAASPAELPLRDIDADPIEYEAAERIPYPSPLPERALSSAKLSALHARLSLSEKLPIQTLARALVDVSADPNPGFNNANLSYLGQHIIAYHVSERLMCRYPRLPMGALFEAMRGYAGHVALSRVARSWGVDSVAAPGEEVDPGLLQWSDKPTHDPSPARLGHVRTEHAYLDKFKWRRGMSSRVVMDDEFGDAIHNPSSHALSQPEDELAAQHAEWERCRDRAYGTFARAVVGAIYVHSGREAAKAFVKSHVLSRQMAMHKLFSFSQPTRDLAMLCQREGFESPVARMLSETGRLSRTPVFVVGIYSGPDKLGEGAGPSLNAARFKAAANSLLAWYLYSPGKDVRVPSDMLTEGAAPWTPVHMDIGEIV